MVHWTEETYVENPEVIGANLRQHVDSAADQVTELLAVLDEHGIEPERALDVACGIGRHAIPLAESGVHVRGVDLSEKYVETARERAADVAGRTTFEVGDMRELSTLGGEYDIVMNWLAFGHFDDETNERVAEALHERVAAGGALVLGVPNRDGTLANYQESSASLDDGLLQVNRSEYAPDTGRLETQITMFRERNGGYETIGEAVCDVRLYAPAELRRLLERVGFSTIHLYASPDGTDLDLDSDRLVVIAEP